MFILTNYFTIVLLGQPWCLESKSGGWKSLGNIWDCRREYSCPCDIQWVERKSVCEEEGREGDGETDCGRRGVAPQTETGLYTFQSNIDAPCSAFEPSSILSFLLTGWLLLSYMWNSRRNYRRRVFLDQFTTHCRYKTLLTIWDFHLKDWYCIGTSLTDSLQLICHDRCFSSLSHLIPTPGQRGWLWPRQCQWDHPCFLCCLRTSIRALLEDHDPLHFAPY